jgi:hypothetical protein
MRVGLLVGVLVVLSRGSPAAQEPPRPPLPADVAPRDSTTHSRPARGTCFRGRPQSECGSFFLTEWTWALRIGGRGPRSPEVKPGNSYWTWQVGWMRNVGRSSAIGGSLFLGLEDDRVGGAETIGVKARFRRWLGPKAAVEVGAGPTTEGSVIAHAAILYGDWVALEVQAEPGQKIFGDRHLATYAGVRFGSLPGTVLGIAAPLALLAVILGSDRID